MKSRKLVLGLLIMLAFVVSSFTYAYWSVNSLAGSEVGNNVEIGEGRRQEVTIALTSPGAATLVPVGEGDNSVSLNPVTSLTFTLNVTWVDNGANEGAINKILNTAVTVNGSATAQSLLIFTINSGTPGLTASQSINEGTGVTVTIVVTLASGASAADYALVFNEILSFDVALVVDPA